MILVDTSVWIDHLRESQAGLVTLLLEGRVTCHPFIIGELACGHLRQRAKLLANLAELPQAPVALHGEAMSFVERHALAGRGIGWLDAHLLASTALSGGLLWTRDERLARVAGEIGVAAGLH